MPLSRMLARPKVGKASMALARLAVSYYAEPTLFGRVHNYMTIAREEVFGPVLVMISFASQ